MVNTDVDVASKEVLAALRAALDPDADQAARKYALLRRRLVRFFEWNGSSAPEACATKALTAAAWKLTDGGAVDNMSMLCATMARNLLARQAPAEPDAFGDPDKMLNAFEVAFDELPADTRDLILASCAGSDATRHSVAQRLGIPPNQVRLRALRARAQVERAAMGLTESGEGR